MKTSSQATAASKISIQTKTVLYNIYTDMARRGKWKKNIPSNSTDTTYVNMLIGHSCNCNTNINRNGITKHKHKYGPRQETETERPINIYRGTKNRKTFFH